MSSSLARKAACTLAVAAVAASVQAGPAVLSAFAADENTAGGGVAASENGAAGISELAADWQQSGIPVAGSESAANAPAPQSANILRDLAGWFKQVANSVYGVVYDDVYGTIRSIVYDTVHGSTWSYVYADVYKTSDGGMAIAHPNAQDKVYNKVFDPSTGNPWKGFAAFDRQFGLSGSDIKADENANCVHFDRVIRCEFSTDGKTAQFISHCKTCNVDFRTVDATVTEKVLKAATPSEDGEVEYTATALIDGKLQTSTTTRAISKLGGGSSSGGSTVTPGGGSSSGGSSTPSTPSSPTTPGGSDQPSTPSDPSTPSEPSTPDQPAGPELPASTTVDKVTYVVDEATGSISASVSAKATTATIRSTVEVDGKTYKVTKLSSSATEGCTKLKTLTVGKGITTISKGALSNCTNLTSLTLGSDVSSVPAKALAKCKKLKTVTIKGGQLSKKQITRLLKGSKVVTVKLEGKAAKAKKASYAKWIKSVKKTIKVKIV